MAPRFQLRSISPDATPEEVAAITAAIAASIRSMAAPPPSAVDPAATGYWVYASRLSARRAGYARGEWRLSGRIGRRSRA
jgi:hypothetical protein